MLERQKSPDRHHYKSSSGSGIMLKIQKRIIWLLGRL